MKSNPKATSGFTLLEMMISAFMMAIIIIGIVSFYQFQGKAGRDSTILRNSREAIDLAMGLIKNDIMHAGYGITDASTLNALFYPDSGSSPPGDKFFISFGRFLTTQNVFSAQAAFDNSNKTFPGGVDLKKELYSIGQKVDDNNLRGWGIFFTKDPFVLGTPAVVNYTLNSGIWSVSCSIPSNNFFAPAVRYFCPSADYSDGTVNYKKGNLYRNETAMIGSETTHYLDITSMRVRFQFFNSSGSTPGPITSEIEWVEWPNNPATYKGKNIRELRVIEVTLNYDMKNTSDQAKPLSASRTMAVTPRNLILSLSNGT